ncbi:MAG: hypothetical protein ACLGIF_06605 [Actinomycetes bacterium]
MTSPFLARFADLGVHGEETARLLRVAATVVKRPSAMETVAAMAERLRSRTGQFPAAEADPVWSGLPDRPDALGAGVFPMPALLVTSRR